MYRHVKINGARDQNEDCKFGSKRSRQSQTYFKRLVISKLNGLLATSATAFNQMNTIFEACCGCLSSIWVSKAVFTEGCEFICSVTRSSVWFSRKRVPLFPIGTHKRCPPTSQPVNRGAHDCVLSPLFLLFWLLLSETNAPNSLGVTWNKLCVCVGGGVNKWWHFE